MLAGTILSGKERQFAVNDRFSAVVCHMIEITAFGTVTKIHSAVFVDGHSVKIPAVSAVELTEFNGFAIFAADRKTDAGSSFIHLFIADTGSNDRQAGIGRIFHILIADKYGISGQIFGYLRPESEGKIVAVGKVEFFRTGYLPMALFKAHGNRETAQCFAEKHLAVKLRSILLKVIVKHHTILERFDGNILHFIAQLSAVQFPGIDSEVFEDSNRNILRISRAFDHTLLDVFARNHDRDGGHIAAVRLAAVAVVITAVVSRDRDQPIFFVKVGAFGNSIEQLFDIAVHRSQPHHITGVAGVILRLVAVIIGLVDGNCHRIGGFEKFAGFRHHFRVTGTFVYYSVVKAQYVSGVFPLIEITAFELRESIGKAAEKVRITLIFALLGSAIGENAMFESRDPGRHRNVIGRTVGRRILHHHTGIGEGSLISFLPVTVDQTVQSGHINVQYRIGAHSVQQYHKHFFVAGLGCGGRLCPDSCRAKQRKQNH